MQPFIKIFPWESLKGILTMYICHKGPGCPWLLVVQYPEVCVNHSPIKSIVKTNMKTLD